MTDFIKWLAAPAGWRLRMAIIVALGTIIGQLANAQTAGDVIAYEVRPPTHVGLGVR